MDARLYSTEWKAGRPSAVELRALASTFARMPSMMRA
jgi:hypothetical protein